jgi:thioesterase domain-containing protein
MAADYVRTLQIRQPAGPYFLGGYSFGGLVAFEMAQQLQRQGHAVALLALLDSGGPVARPSSAEPLVVRLKRYTLELTARLWLAYVRDGRTVPPRWRMSYFLGTSHLVRRAYQAAVFQGRLVLLRARENARDPQRRWGGLARLGLDVRDVPGNHVSMLEEPQVQLTAAMLDRVLREAQEP